MPVSGGSAADLVRRTATVCAQHGRRDLVSRLTHTSRRIADPSVRVLVVGEFKQGKSLLINALVGAPVCPVDDDLATSVPLDVRFGEVPTAALLLAPSATASSLDASVKEEPIPLDTLAGTLMRHPERPDGMTVVGARASLPRALLKDGLVLVDTPGVGGLASSHSAEHGGGPAQCRRRDPGVRCLQRVHGAGGHFPSAGPQCLPDGALRAVQDRPLPPVAAGARDRPGAPRPPRPPAADDGDLVQPAPRRGVPPGRHPQR